MKFRRVAMFSMMLAILTAQSATTDVNFKDIDSDVMQGMDDAIKDLEPVLSAGNVTSAAADATVLRDGLKWTVEYFAAKGNVEDGVQIARNGQTLVAELFEHLEQKNLPAAIEVARKTAKNCRSCHDIYKP